MEVAFSKPDDKGRVCSWTARRGRRQVVPGPTMAAGAGLPHDLGQYVVEASLGIERGFWGLVAKGATFRSTGRKVTPSGRAVILEHKADLDEAERIANEHVERWKSGAATPAADHLDTALGQWRELEVGERLVFRWPSPTGVVTAG